MPSVKPGVTVSPPDTASSRVTVKRSESPSAALASATVNVATSSSSMRPVAVPAVTVSDVPETDRPTVKVSSCSTAVS